MTTTILRARDTLPIHPYTGMRALGVLPSGRPVWPALGGAPDDEGDDLGMDLGAGGKKAVDPTKGGGKTGDDKPDSGDDASQDSDEEDDGDDSGDDGEWTPPSREEWERMQAALTKANKESADRRKKLQAARREQRAAQKAADTAPEGTPAGADADAISRAKQEAAEEAERRYKPAAIRASFTAALMKANFQHPTDARISRALRQLDQDEIEVGDDGTIDGLDEQVEDLVEDFPEWFTPAKTEESKPEPRRRRAPRIDGADKPPTKPEPKTTGEKHAARVLGGAR